MNYSRGLQPSCCSKGEYEMTPLAMGWAKSEDKLGFSYAIDHFFDCIRNDRTPLTSPEDAYRTHLLLNKILEDAGLPAMD